MLILKFYIKLGINFHNQIKSNLDSSIFFFFLFSSTGFSNLTGSIEFLYKKNIYIIVWTNVIYVLILKVIMIHHRILRIKLLIYLKHRLLLKLVLLIWIINLLLRIHLLRHIDLLILLEILLIILLSLHIKLVVSLSINVCTKINTIQFR